MRQAGLLVWIWVSKRMEMSLTQGARDFWKWRSKYASLTLVNLDWPRGVVAERGVPELDLESK
jgi:hypothetical protein